MIFCVRIRRKLSDHVPGVLAGITAVRSPRRAYIVEAATAKKAENAVRRYLKNQPPPGDEVFDAIPAEQLPKPGSGFVIKPTAHVTEEQPRVKEHTLIAGGTKAVKVQEYEIGGGTITTTVAEYEVGGGKFQITRIPPQPITRIRAQKATRIGPQVAYREGRRRS